MMCLLEASSLATLASAAVDAPSYLLAWRALKRAFLNFAAREAACPLFANNAPRRVYRFIILTGPLLPVTFASLALWAEGW